jgi:hypothetical protein
VTYSYNILNDISVSLNEVYNTDSLNWISGTTYYYLYDANDNLDRIIYLCCTTPACDDTITFEDYTYDSLGRITYANGSNLNNQGFTFLNYSYDSNGDTTYAGYMYPGGPCGAGADEYFTYNSGRSITYTSSTTWSGCQERYTDCYIYDLGPDSMVVEILYPMPVCTNDTVYPIVFCAGGISPQTFDWSTGIHFSDSTIEQPYLLAVTSEVYTLSMTDLNGRTVSDTMNIIVSMPFPDLGLDTTLCTNSSIELEPGIFSRYDWSDGSGASTLILSSSVEDSIYVSVTVQNQYSCIGSDTVLVVFNECTGIQEIENITSVYPNPFHDRIIIKNDGENSVCYIYSRDGKILKSFQLQFGENNIETTDLIAGIYVLVIDNEKNHRLNYIIKE